MHPTAHRGAYAGVSDSATGRLTTCPNCTTPSSSRRSRAGTTPVTPPATRWSTSTPSGKPRPIVEIDDEAYYDYQVNRPVIRQVDGVTRELVWPSMRISHCRPPGSDRDIVLMHGVEPNMRWRTFCAELLAIADKLNVDTVVILGALLADTPHTRPVPVSGAAYSPESAQVLRAGGDPLRGPDRHRRGVPGRLRGGGHPRGDVLGGGAALRVAAAEPEGHRRAAAPRRGRARHRGAAGRSADRRPRSGSRRSPR